MGMYTELIMAIELKRDTPSEIITVLEHLLQPLATGRPEVDNNHPLFDTGHFNFILNGDSYYFPGKSNSILELEGFPETYRLTIRSNLKNYDQEIQKFLRWIAPFSQTGTFTPGTSKNPPTGPGRKFAGYFCYEEDEWPTLIYFQEGQVYLVITGSTEWKVLEF